RTRVRSPHLAPCVLARLAHATSVSVVLYLSDRHTGDALAAADPAHALVGGRLDRDPAGGRLAEDLLHLRLVRTEARLLADQGRVDVDDATGDRADRGAQEIDRVGVAPALLLRREERADVTAPRGAEDRVDHRVGEHVGVGVAQIGRAS